MADRPQINISSIKVAGVGGLGMVALVGVIAYALPEVRAFVLVSCAGGVIGGTGLIAYRRWIKPEPPHGPTLMVNTTANTATTADSESGRIARTVKLSPVVSAE